MNFQTVFYLRSTGTILHVEPNKYIKSKWEKVRICPGHRADDLGFLYFPSGLPIDQTEHSVLFISAVHPPVVVDKTGLPIIYLVKKLPFLKAKEQYSTMIVDLADSMGDKLYRAAAVIEAQKVYPGIKFFCKCEEREREVMSMVEEITLFDGYKEHSLDPKKCGLITMAAGQLSDPLGIYFSAPSRYGLFLGLDFVPYTLRFTLPDDFDEKSKAFGSRIGLKNDGQNIVMQLRTKDEESRSWSRESALELASMVKAFEYSRVYFVGTPLDFPGEYPDVINLCGKTTWMETCYLLSKADKVICIDSSCLHLCHALGVSPYRVWGRTHPLGVLGEDPGPRDISSSPDFAKSDIKAISALDVFNRIFPEVRSALPLVYNPARDTSQQHEQQHIFEYFKTHPPGNHIIVDVGAYGREMSNSFALLDLGWQGLLVEADPGRVKVLKREFAGLDVSIRHAAVSDKKGKAALHVHSIPGHTSLLQDWYPDTDTGQSINVDAYPLKTILQEGGIPIDFALLSIDTEGMDEKIMSKLFTSSKYRPKLIVTECTSYQDPIAFFNEFGYTLFARTGDNTYGNLILARE